jgi:trehalose 6-phosphate synthase/phosphatase
MTQVTVPKLIVVSNREPYEHRRRDGRLVCERTDGGLTSALDPALRRLGGMWIAWGSGEGDRQAVGPDDTVAVPPDKPSYQLRRVWLTSPEIKHGYLGYANQVLWPLCHITLDRVAYRKAFWHAYQTLNARFAQAVLEELRKRPAAVWVHDFHLALLPRLIKQTSPDRPVALFWHIPWPGPDVFRILPERQEVLEGLLAADSLVFQTSGYAQMFAECAHHFVDAKVDPSGEAIEHKGHRTRISARPISVDYQTFSQGAVAQPVKLAMHLIRRRLGAGSNVRFGLGVDRLDYTKGLLKRLWALGAFFSRYPQYRGLFTFIQVAVPTRSEVEAYRRYRDVIRETVEDINRRYGQRDRAGAPEGLRWRPIALHEGRIGFDTLLAYYRMAELALVSSVYDGMNLVAKEYVASQADESGVLLVSEMAGSAEELTDALIINPYDPEGLADAIKQALEMPVEERRRRMRSMRAHLEQHDIHAWVAGCLRDAEVEPDRQSASLG